MTDETANLVLELLRNMRGELATMRGEMDALRAEMRAGFAAVGERLEAVENELRGVTSIMTSSIGSLLNELQDHETRITRLEVLRP